MNTQTMPELELSQERYDLADPADSRLFFNECLEHARENFSQSRFSEYREDSLGYFLRDVMIMPISDIECFLDNDEPAREFVFGEYELYKDGDDDLIIHRDGELYCIGHISYLMNISDLLDTEATIRYRGVRKTDINNVAKLPASAVALSEWLCDDKRLGDNAFPILVNGDTDDDYDQKGNVIIAPESNFNGFDLFESFPTISFTCGSRFFDCKAVEFGKMLADGTLLLVDFTPDSTKDISDSIAEKAKKEKMNIREYVRNNSIVPEQGYSLLASGDKYGYCWHRAATILLCDTRDDCYYIFGQDEGTYFGCKLQGKPNTISEAYIDLMPEEIRNVKGVIRQGEWFAVPVKKSDVPNIADCDFTLDCDHMMNSVILKLDDEDSNRHCVSSSNNSSAYQDLPIRIKGNQVYAFEFAMEHEEHVTIQGKANTWYTFVCNTALQSFSVAGVD